MNPAKLQFPTIREAFERKKGKNTPAFIPYITAGYPSREATIDVALALQEAGADILELGIPYSDPLADGPVIQKSSEAAIRQGMTFRNSLQLITDLRTHGVSIPIIVFCYYNPIFQYGLQSFVQDASDAGANGVIIPDLPLEEAQAIKQYTDAERFPLILLVAPTSKTRIERITAETEGFVYCVSSLGVTGVRDTFSADIESFLQDVRKSAAVPLAVGFGISKREQVRYLQPSTDGIVVGSAVIRMLIENEEALLSPEKKQHALENIKRFVQQLFSE